MTEVLLVGGPMDGEIVKIQTGQRDLRVMEPVGRLTYAGNVDPLSVVPTKTTRYVLERIALFGFRFEILLHESLKNGPERDRDVAVARHILSTTAMVLIMHNGNGRYDG